MKNEKVGSSSYKIKKTVEKDLNSKKGGENREGIIEGINMINRKNQFLVLFFDFATLEMILGKLNEIFKSRRQKIGLFFTF